MVEKTFWSYFRSNFLFFIIIFFNCIHSQSIDPFLQFGGKLLTFQKDNLDPNLPISRKVIISQLITQTELVKRSNELEDVLKNEQYQHYCQEKIMKSIDDHNQEVWRCVEAYFNNNFSKRIMEILGFDSDEMNNKLNQLVPQQDINNMTDKMDNVS